VELKRRMRKLHFPLRWKVSITPQRRVAKDLNAELFPNFRSDTSLNKNLAEMTYSFTSKNGRDFEIDLTQWMIDEDRRSCKVIATMENDVILENVHGDRFSLPEHILKVNRIKVEENRIDLSKGLYEVYLTKKLRVESKRRLDEAFKEYAPLIFQRRDLVLSRAEYYLLKPSVLLATLGFEANKHYTLGGLCESIENGNHVHFDEFGGFRDMYLIGMTSSPLSGSVFSANFWSGENGELIRFGYHPQRPIDLGGKSLGHFIRSLPRNMIMIDRQDRAIEQLITEIRAAEK
jgi:hypothetical protein